MVHNCPCAAYYESKGATCFLAHFTDEKPPLQSPRITSFLGRYRDIREDGIAAITEAVEKCGGWKDGKGIQRDKEFIVRPLLDTERTLKDGEEEYEVCDGNHRKVVFQRHGIKTVRCTVLKKQLNGQPINARDIEVLLDAVNASHDDWTAHATWWEDFKKVSRCLNISGVKAGNKINWQLLMSLANNRVSMKESNCKRYVTLANVLKNKPAVHEYINNLHKRLGSAMPISKTMLTENNTLQGLESDCLVSCLKDLQGQWEQAIREAKFEKQSKASQKYARDIVKTGYYPKQWVSEAVRIWTVRAKSLFKLGRCVGVPSELKTQYMDFVKQGHLDKIENVDDPTQSSLFRALSAAMRKQLPVAELPNVLQHADEEDILETGSSSNLAAQHAQTRIEADEALAAPVAANQATALVATNQATATPVTANQGTAIPMTSGPASHAPITTPVQLVASPNTNRSQMEHSQPAVHSQQFNEADSDLPFGDDDLSTPTRKKRSKLSLDALSDWQKALRDKVVDWTTTNFTLLESVDDISLTDDPSLFVIEEQDAGLANSSLFRHVLRASSAKKPLRLVWAVAGLDSVAKVAQAITTKGGNLYWRWLASISNPPQNGKLQKSPQLSTIDWLFFGQSPTQPKALNWHAPSIQELDEKDKNAFLDHAVFRWPGKAELQQSTSR